MLVVSPDCVIRENLEEPMRSLGTLTGIGMAMLAIACRDDARRSVAGPPGAPDAGSVLYLTVSSEAPPPGSTVTVTANVALVPNLKAIGSFSAHLRYDTAGLAFVAESKLPTGIRALNSQPGYIRA